MLFTPAMAAVGHYFRAKLGTAMGIVVTGSSLGGVIFPIALTRMIDNPALGFGWSVRINGFIVLFMLSIAVVTIRARLPPRKGRQVLLPSAFKKPTYTLFVVAVFFILWGLFTPFFYITQYATEKGMSTNLASYLISMLNAASVFGRLLPGLVADKFGRFNILFLAAACTGILLFCWLAVKSSAAIIVFSVLYGFFSGAIVSLMSPCVAFLTPDPRNIGTYLGMAMAVISVAGLTGTPISGAMLSHYKSYTEAACFSGAVVLFGTFLLFIVKVSLKRSLFAKV